MTALVARALTAGYGARGVLQGIDLTLEPGVLVALVGPNGAGKSTLLRALAGLIRPTAGAVTLDGIDVATLSRAALAARIAVVGAAALLTGAAVALAGLVGFVGLVIPHALRPIVGATHRTLAVASFLAGASVLVLADLGARSVFAPAELPVGVLTGLLGAPFFLLLLVRARRREVT